MKFQEQPVFRVVLLYNGYITILESISSLALWVLVER